MSTAFRTLACAFVVFACCSTMLAEETSPIGKRIESFALEDYLGGKHSLEDWSDSNAVVVVFLGTQCPVAKHYGSRLAELDTEYKAKGVKLIGIDSNQQDTLTEIAHYAREHKIEFPLLKDPANKVADQFGAVRTPEAFVLDADRVVRYWGRIDDQFGVGYARPKAGERYLAAALDELLADKPITTAMVESVGCHIGRARRVEPTGDVTYSNQIARLFQKHCVECHREGQVAPFAMTSYEEVAPWAETISEVIEDRRMPPWHANPEHGKFWNDTSLSEQEKKLVYQWVKNGAPEGNRADLPEPVDYVEDWRIGQPEVVYKMPEPFQVPARGTVEYQYFEVHPGFAEDKWLKAAEVRPGNRSVVHHLVLFYHPGNGPIDPGEALFHSLAAFAPGMPPSVYFDGISRRIPAGAKLVLQVHYTPNGTEQTDLSQTGLIFADPKTVKKELSVAAALNWQFRIPAGANNYRVQATHRFDQDTLLYSLTPHMHLRGKAFRFEAKYPDGTSEVLLDVPRYDFNWQNFYIPSEPKRMPEGTEMHCTAWYDNSAENLANPNPSSAVMWGDQTWQEMMVGTFAISPEEQDLSAPGPQAKSLGNDQYEVLFSYRPPKKAEAVYIAGSFNEWKPDSQKMEGPNDEGEYTARVVLKKGTHEYKFVVDGKSWRTDPAVTEVTGFYRNSVVRVGQ